MILYFTIVALNLFECILKKNYKILNIATCVYILTFVGGNSFNADYSGYKYYYDHQLDSAFEQGYLRLSAFAHQLGLEYQYFVLLLVGISLVIFLLAVKYFKISFPAIAVLYLSTMSFLDAVQVRQYLCYCIFTVALIALANKKKLLYVICIFVAASFQISSLLYLPLVFLVGENAISKKLTRIFVGSILLMCGLVFINGNTIPFLGNFLSRFLATEKLVYFDTRTRYGFIKYFLFQFVVMWASYITVKYIKTVGEGKIVRFAHVVNRSILFSCVAMPLVMLNNNFMRYFKFSLLGLMILMAYSIFLLLSKNDDKNLRYVTLLSGKKGKIDVYILICLIVVGAYWYSIQVPTVVADVFANNMFF